MDDLNNLQNQVLVYNGKIWVSGSEDKHWFTFSVSSGRVIDIGSDPHPKKEDYKQAIDAGCSRIFPGFHDSHIHVGSLGESLMSADLRGCDSIQDMQVRLKLFAEANPDTAWLVGRFWEQDLLSRYPTKEDVDAVCSDRPAYIPRICDHIVLVNSKALQIAGITKATVDPAGGVIDRYPAGHPLEGEPTGLLRESSAFTMVEKHRLPSKEEKMSWIKKGLDVCLKNGVVAVHSIEYYWDEYCELARNNQLPIRVFISSYFDGRHSGNFPQFPGQTCGELLSSNRVKLFVDGALGACTASLSRCYKNHPKNSGLLLQTQECLNHLVNEANSAGFRLEMHIIGDKAADAALTALEVAKVTPERRPILTHCQVLSEELVERMVKQQAIANIQPQFVTTDARWVPHLLPPDLLSWSYPWKSLLRRGLVCAGGSDSPVETPEPLVGIYDAIYRPDGERNPGSQTSFRPEECLTVQEAVDCYTKSGAYTAMKECDLGQLMPGYMADFVMIDGATDPVVNPECFVSAKVKQVWVGGKRKL